MDASDTIEERKADFALKAVIDSGVAEECPHYHPVQTGKEHDGAYTLAEKRFNAREPGARDFATIDDVRSAVRHQIMEAAFCQVCQGLEM